MNSAYIWTRICVRTRDCARRVSVGDKYACLVGRIHRIRFCLGESNRKYCSGNDGRRIIKIGCKMVRFRKWWSMRWCCYLTLIPCGWLAVRFVLFYLCPFRHAISFLFVSLFLSTIRQFGNWTWALGTFNRFRNIIELHVNAVALLKRNEHQNTQWNEYQTVAVWCNTNARVLSNHSWTPSDRLNALKLVYTSQLKFTSKIEHFHTARPKWVPL